MILNYIKIAWRNLIKQRLFSFINISGLAVGLAVCITIMTYVAHEMSYDRFQKNGDRIFNPVVSFKTGGTRVNMEFMSYAAADIIKRNQPSVEAYMRTMAYFRAVVASNPAFPDKKFSASKLLFADAGFFNFFSFKLLSGSPDNVLDKPFTVVISKDVAEKYFGKENPIGKTITLKTDNIYNYLVTGVAENAPSNSSIDFNFVTSNLSLLAMQEAKNYVGAKQISYGNFNVYLLLHHAADTAALRRNLDLMAKKDKVFDDVRYSLAPLLKTHLEYNLGDSSNTKYLKIFPLVAILILLLALVNYMSLSTARATLRAREVGVRKVTGASRKTIALQFYIESALFATLSFVLGYILSYAFKPWFLNVLQLKIDDQFLYSPAVLLSLLSLLVLTALIAGSYPSLVLSAFKPVTTLKGKMSKMAGGVMVRKVFTTLQFAISVGLIICGIVIDRQLYFFRHADTGINRDNVVMIPVEKSMGKNYPAFKQEVQAIAGISNVATARYGMFKGYDMFSINGKTPNEFTMLNALTTNAGFINTLGLKWKFAPTRSLESTGRKVVINELAIDKLHLSGDPVGTFIQSGDQKVEIAGVLKNFNFGSMETAIQPLGLFLLPDSSRYFANWGCNLFARINPHTNLPTLLGQVQAIYKKYDQDAPFEYTFMDDAFNAQYKAEDRLASIFSVFTYITVILATLGLFGLAAFTIEQRTKEIGIRKVLGASLASINNLLSREFLKLVVLAIMIASPVAWWAMHSWLQGFAYRIAISWWVFAAAGMIAVLTAILTVSYHAIRAGVANPVDSLRSE